MLSQFVSAMHWPPYMPGSSSLDYLDTSRFSFSAKHTIYCALQHCTNYFDIFKLYIPAHHWCSHQGFGHSWPWPRVCCLTRRFGGNGLVSPTLLIPLFLHANAAGSHLRSITIRGCRGYLYRQIPMGQKMEVVKKRQATLKISHHSYDCLLKGMDFDRRLYRDLSSWPTHMLWQWHVSIYPNGHQVLCSILYKSFCDSQVLKEMATRQRIPSYNNRIPV